MEKLDFFQREPNVQVQAEMSKRKLKHPRASQNVKVQAEMSKRKPNKWHTPINVNRMRNL